jgi:hypothetical protein
VSGRDAVAASKSFHRLRAAEAPSLQWLDEENRSEGGLEKLVERVGTRTFYWVNNRWVDASYDGRAESRKVELFSEAYFKLIRDHPELARCFALGERVLVVLVQTVYETVPPAAENE